MIALCKTKKGPGADLIEIDRPVIRPDELLVKVHRASICGSDVPIYFWKGYAKKRIKVPLVFGHEFCGEVVEAGESTRGFKPGDFVSAESHIFCGLCYQCRNGERHICRNLKIIGIDFPGAYAEYARLPARCAWKHRDGSFRDIGSLFEPLGNAVYATLAEEVVGKSVLVLGCGPQGLFAIQIARSSGAKPVIAVESSPLRKKLARKMGADLVLDPSIDRLAERIVAASGRGGGVDVVLEMSGNSRAVSLAMKAVRGGGRITAFGLPSRKINIDWEKDVVFKGIRIYGICGREIFQSWYTMERLLGSGAVDIRPVITHTFSLRNHKKAFEVMASPKKNCGKVILEVGND